MFSVCFYVKSTPVSSHGIKPAYSCQNNSHDSSYLVCKHLNIYIRIIFPLYFILNSFIYESNYNNKILFAILINVILANDDDLDLQNFLFHITSPRRKIFKML